YYTSIIVGNQEFCVLLDTGSSNLWIPNNNCTDYGCQNVRRFNSSQSPTFKPEDNKWEILYGSGFAFGITEKDNIQIANLTAIEQIFGGVDKSKFEGNIMFTPVINSDVYDGFWIINLEYVNLFDTGTTLLIIPDDDATAIHKQIPESKFDEEQGLYIIPCNTTTVVSLKFGGVNYEIPSKDLSFDKASESQ
ncbi:11587_t:CDS:2, partial [Gigaspora rosea]